MKRPTLKNDLGLTFKQAEKAFAQAMKDGWSGNVAGRKAGFDYNNFRLFLKLSPKSKALQQQYTEKGYQKKQFDPNDRSPVYFKSRVPKNRRP